MARGRVFHGPERRCLRLRRGSRDGPDHVRARGPRSRRTREPRRDRATAYTQAEIWEYATPGTVEMHLVPSLPEGTDPTGVTADQLKALHTSTALEAVQVALEKRKPVGIRAAVAWTDYKTVRVKAEI